MPVLGADMDVGTISEWRIGVGDQVRRGDIVAVIETEKSDVDAEAFEDGIVRELVVPVGQEVPVGTVLARLDPLGPPDAPPGRSAGGQMPTVADARDREPNGTATPAANPTIRRWSEPPVTPGLITSPVVRHLAEREGVDPSTIVGTGPGHRVTRADVEHLAPTHGPSTTARVRATPLARHLAQGAGIDLAGVRGSGPGGAVLARDLDAVRAPAPPRPPGGSAPGDASSTSSRDAVARQMARSKREIPHYYLQQTIDLGAARQWLDAENERHPITERLVPAALLLTAVARAASRAPRMNGHWLEDRLVTADEVHLGVAISRREGLVAPAIAGAGRLGVHEVMHRMQEVVSRVRSGRLRSSDLVPPTITVTNLGERGTDVVLGVIYPPQVALIGFGSVAERPVVHDGAIVARPTVVATLAGDHRASDGHDGARFLHLIDQLLQEPEQLR